MFSPFKNCIYLKKDAAKLLHTTFINYWNLPKHPSFDTSYLCDPNNLSEINNNIKLRKGVGDINLVHDLKHKLTQSPTDNQLKEEFYLELFKIPNKTHPAVENYGTEPHLVKQIGTKQEREGVLHFQEIVKKLRLVRTEQLGNFAGNKSYFLLGELAELEQALIRYVVSKLLQKGFQLVSVPDILPRGVIEGCGMNTRGTRSQVYSLDPTAHNPDLCLSGTAEMALAGYLSGKNLPADSLPLKLAAISRCYRAETSKVYEERGLYRVHEFTKVEMFIACLPDDSNKILEDLREQQEEIFENLELCFKVLDMPPHELGAHAYRKYDVEAWMEGRGLWGEISSCSNCLDYQTRRLDIKSGDEFLHTLNGTACAIPRLLIALIEKGQQSRGFIEISKALWGYMRDKKVIKKQKKMPDLKLIKRNKQY